MRRDALLLVLAVLRRMVRYGCVGAGITVFYSLAVVALVRSLDPISPVWASVLAFIVTLPLSWLAHGRISFSDRPRDVFQPVRFACSTVSSFMIAVGGMYWITNIGGHHYLFGILWNWLVIPGMNFAGYMFWVFRAAKAPAAHDGTGAHDNANLTSGTA